jgi:hypothetical protein
MSITGEARDHHNVAIVRVLCLRFCTFRGRAQHELLVLGVRVQVESEQPIPRVRRCQNDFTKQLKKKSKHEERKEKEKSASYFPSLPHQTANAFYAKP